MDIFVVEGTVVKPTEHALLLYPYSEIWDRDPDPSKANAIRDFKYIEFSCSYKKSNPFKGYDEEIRKQKIIESVYQDDADTFEEDDLIIRGIELYEEFRLEASPTIKYFLAAKLGAEKMMKWLKDFDMTDTNDRTGAPLYKPREITSALKDTYDVMKTLDALESKVFEQIFEHTKTRSNKETNHFEK